MIRKYRTIALALCMILLVSVLASGCANGSKGEGDASVGDTSLSDVQAKGVLTVGCDDGFPPMGFMGPDDKITGFDIQLAQAVAKKLGVKADIQAIDWKTKEMSLNSNKIDVIWNGYTITKERNDQVEFTKPYLNNKQVIVVLKNSPVAAKADLKGKNVGAQVDSSGLQAIKDDKEFKNSLAKVSEYDQYLPALLDLQNKRLDGVVIDKVVIDYVMNQTPGIYKILNEDLGSEYYGIGCHKGGVALREAIDKAIDQLDQDGTINKLCSKWFGQNIVIRNVDKLTDAQLEQEK